MAVTFSPQARVPVGTSNVVMMMIMVSKEIFFSSPPKWLLVAHRRQINHKKWH